MADVQLLQDQFVAYALSLFHERYVDWQFVDVQSAREVNQKFPAILLETYFNNSPGLINSMTEILAKPESDFKEVFKLAQTLKGSSATTGFAKICKICEEFEKLCKEKNIAMLKRCVERLHYENSNLKSKIDTLLRLENQIINAGGEAPVFELTPSVSIPPSPNRR